MADKATKKEIQDARDILPRMSKESLLSVLNILLDRADEEAKE